MSKILNKREKVLLSITLIVVIFAIVFNLAVSPVLKKNEALNKEISLNRARLNKYARLLSQKENILAGYSKLTSGANISEGENVLTGLLSELEGLANNADIRIIDLRPESSREKERYKEINIDLRTEGTMEGYLRFIYDLENSLSLLRIKKLQLNSRPNTQLLEGVFSISQLSLSD